MDVRAMQPLADNYCRLGEVAATIQPAQADAQIGHLVGGLTVCYHMLEEENAFLRRQVTTLVT